MCSRELLAVPHPARSFLSKSDTSAASAEPVPFAQISFNGGNMNPLWDYFVAHKEGPVLHKWCGARECTLHD